MTKKHIPLVLTALVLALAVAPAQADRSPAQSSVCMPRSQFGSWSCATAAPTASPQATAKPQATAAPVSWNTDMASQVIVETNAERAKYGLKALTVDAELTRAAQVRAQEIARKFSHTRPDGSSCFTVSDKAFGENIARGYTYAAKVMAAWLSSEGHRANILRASYSSIGVACAQINGIWHWVQLFGR